MRKQEKNARAKRKMELVCALPADAAFLAGFLRVVGEEELEREGLQRPAFEVSAAGAAVRLCAADRTAMYSWMLAIRKESEPQ